MDYLFCGGDEKATCMPESILFLKGNDFMRLIGGRNAVFAPGHGHFCTAQCISLHRDIKRIINKIATPLN
jgi:hypothetical protein